MTFNNKKTGILRIILFLFLLFQVFTLHLKANSDINPVPVKFFVFWGMNFNMDPFLPLSENAEYKNSFDLNFYLSNDYIYLKIKNLQTFVFYWTLPLSRIYMGQFSVRWGTGIFSGIPEIFPFDFFYENIRYKIIPQIYFPENESILYSPLSSGFFYRFSKSSSLYFFNEIDYDGNSVLSAIYELNLAGFQMQIIYENQDKTIELFEKDIDGFSRLCHSLKFSDDNWKIIAEMPLFLSSYMNSPIYIIDLFADISYKKVEYLFLYKSYAIDSETYFEDNFFHCFRYKNRGFIAFIYLPYDEYTFISKAENQKIGIKFRTGTKFGLTGNYTIEFFPNNLCNGTFILPYEEEVALKITLDFSIKLNKIFIQQKSEIYLSGEYELFLRIHYIYNSQRFSASYYTNQTSSNRLFFPVKSSIYDFNLLSLQENGHLIELSWQIKDNFQTLFCKLIVKFYDKKNELYLYTGGLLCF